MRADPLILDPALFDLAAIDPEIATQNAEIAAFQKAAPSPWSMPEAVVREARRQGRGVFPAARPDPAAEVVEVRGRDGNAIPVRVMRPSNGARRGTYLHIHGGGWVFGAAVENDVRLRALSEATGLSVASVDYRLSPENPFPAGPNDCLDVALALVGGTLAGLPTRSLAIGGESAGAHLSVLTLIALRDVHALTPFGAANLVAGCFDLALTPSVRRFGEDRLVLNTSDIGEFVRRFVPAGVSPSDPAVSPLHADLAGLAPALFTCGTGDLLIDDTLFMAQRWAAAGNGAALSLTNGGAHVFQAFPSAAASASLARMHAFLDEALD